MNGAMRTIGRPLTVAAVGLILAGLGAEVGAAEAQKRPDFGSKAAFKAECEALDGTFSEDGLGNTECRYDNGAWTECDENGNDCWHTPAERQVPGFGSSFDGVAVPLDGIALDKASPGSGEQVVAPDDVPVPTKHKAKGGKKGKHGGKKRKR